MTERLPEAPEEAADLSPRMGSATGRVVPQGIIELREERLTVEKRREVAGSVTFTRELRRETVQVPVELLTEVLVIEHSGGPQAVVLDGRPLQVGERREVILYREEAVVEKHVVVSEEVRVGTRQLTETRTLDVTLAREELVVHDDRDALPGNLTNPER